MDPRRRVLTTVAGQLGRPHGLPGRLVGRLLNRGNRGAITAAVDALRIEPGATLADLGFGGGLGLGLLLRGVGETGHVHGVDVSTTMLAAAGRRFGHEVSSGRLALHDAGLERLPLPAGSLDGAITVNTIYFIADLAGAFDECARVIKPGGRLVVGLGDPDAMARLPFTAHGFRLRTVAQVGESLAGAGLAVDDHRRVGSRNNAYHLLVSTRSPDGNRERGALPPVPTPAS